MAFRQMRTTLPAALGVVGTLFGGYSLYKQPGETTTEISTANKTTMLPQYVTATETRPWDVGITGYEFEEWKSMKGQDLPSSGLPLPTTVEIKGGSFHSETGTRYTAFRKQSSTGWLAHVLTLLGLLSFFYSVIAQSGFLSGVVVTLIACVLIQRVTETDRVRELCGSIHTLVLAFAKYYSALLHQWLSDDIEEMRKQNSIGLLRLFLTASGLTCLIVSTSENLSFVERSILIVIGVILQLLAWFSEARQFCKSIDDLVTAVTRYFAKKMFEHVAPQPLRVLQVPNLNFMLQNLRHNNAELTIRNRRLETDLKRETKERVGFENNVYKLKQEKSQLMVDAKSACLDFQDDISGQVAEAEREKTKAENEWKRKRVENAALQKEVENCRKDHYLIKRNLENATTKPMELLKEAVEQNNRLAMQAKIEKKATKDSELACQLKHNALEEVTKEKIELEGKHTNLAKEFKELKDKVDDLSKGKSELDHDKSGLQNAKGELEIQITDLTNEKSAIEHDRGELEKEKSALAKDKSELESLVANLTQNKEQVEKEKVELKSRVEALEAEKQSQPQADADDMEIISPEEAKLNAQEDELKELKRGLNEEQTKSIQLANQVQQLNEQLSSSASAASTEIQGLQGHLKDAKKHSEDANAQIKDLQDQLKKAQGQMAEAEQKDAGKKEHLASIENAHAVRIADFEDYVSTLEASLEAKGVQLKDSEREVSASELQMYVDDLTRTRDLLDEVCEQGINDDFANVVLEKVTIADSNCNVLLGELQGSKPVNWEMHAKDFSDTVIDIEEIAMLDDNWVHLKEQARMVNHRLKLLRLPIESVTKGGAQPETIRNAVLQQLLAPRFDPAATGKAKQDNHLNTGARIQTGSSPSNAQAPAPSQPRSQQPARAAGNNSEIPGLSMPQAGGSSNSTGDAQTPIDFSAFPPIDVDAFSADFDAIAKQGEIDARPRRAPRSRKQAAAGPSSGPQAPFTFSMKNPSNGSGSSGNLRNPFSDAANAQNQKQPIDPANLDPRLFEPLDAKNAGSNKASSQDPPANNQIDQHDSSLDELFEESEESEEL